MRRQSWPPLHLVALTLVFTLSFVSYMQDSISNVVQLVPLLLFAVIVLVNLFTSGSGAKSVADLFDGDGLLFVIFIGVLIVAISLASGSDTSSEAAFVIAATLLLSRLYMALVPIERLLEAFFWSGVLSIALFLFAGFSSFLHSMETLERLSPFSFHPNLLGFFAAGYFCAMIWKFLQSGWRMRLLSGVVGAACLLIMFFASSRGSLIGVLLGCCTTAVAASIRGWREGRFRFSGRGLAIVGVLLIIIGSSYQSEIFQEVFQFADQALAITDSNRGIGSGFTGRADKWKETLGSLTDGSWLVGKGIRTSDTIGEDQIDNSYVVILYELGPVCLLLIVFRFLDITRRLFLAYINSSDRDCRSCYLALLLVIVSFLANNFVARYLFSVGNSFSLICLFLFVTPSSKIKVKKQIETSRGCIGPAQLLTE